MVQTGKPTQGSEHRTDTGSLAGKAREAASSIGETARHAAESAGHAAQDWTNRAGSGMSSLGRSIGENAPHGGVVGSVAGTVADTLERGGRYLSEEGLSGLAGDMTSVIRRNPITTVLIAVGVGYLFARMTES